MSHDSAFPSPDLGHKVWVGIQISDIYSDQKKPITINTAKARKCMSKILCVILGVD